MATESVEPIERWTAKRRGAFGGRERVADEAEGR
jgi:hypothetical protein